MAQLKCDSCGKRDFNNRYVERYKDYWDGHRGLICCKYCRLLKWVPIPSYIPEEQHIKYMERIIK